MSKRLVKVAKELNVGTKTIVEFLNGNGFSVSNKPTAKISDEMYDALAKNFQNSIAIREKADKITIGTRKTKEEQQKEKEVLEAKEQKEQEEREVVEHVEKEANETPQKEEQTPPPPVEEKPVEPVVEPKEEKPVAEEANKNVLSGPKILGKINLDETNKRGKKKPKQNKEKQAPKKVVERSQDEKKTTEQPKKEVLQPKVEQKTVVEKPVEKAPRKEEQKPAVQKVVAEKKEEPPKDTSKPTSDKPVKDATPQKEGEVKPKTAENALDIKVEAPQLKGLKILGKIDISSSKKRKRKKKDDDDKSNDRKERRKRPRVKTVRGSKTGDDKKKDDKKKDDKSKPSDNKEDRKRNFKKPDKPASNTSKRKKKGKRREINEKEVGDKLKATMNLMGGRGKSKKRFGASRKERDEQRAERIKEMEISNEEAPKIQVTEFISVQELAGLMNISATEIIMACMNEKRMVSINQRMDRELIELMGIEFGYEIEFVSAEDQMEKDYQIEDDELEDNTARSPIVTVMGHVDHGKTSLLDSIRKANVAGAEAGGITQHIGAYEVKVGEQGTITFLDTPGHEAFTAMRARGAKVTDVAVIIISADDSIMPQTKEAISHAQAAEVPIIFAINKIDKEGANPERIKQELASMDLLVEEWGGKYQSQDISAKQGLNIDLLLEKILLEAEMLELKANPEKRAVGTVLEASLEKGRGYVAKILVRNGTLSIGDAMVAGPHYGRVKAMFNERGKRVKVAGPATPVLVLGLQGAPQAGETINVLTSEKEAKDLAAQRANLVRQQQIRATRRVTLEDLTNRIKIGNFQELNLIVKGDFDGSVEALSDSLLKLSTDQVQTNIIYSAVGPITESDVNLAAASNAIIVGFQVRPNPMARRLAEKEGVEINTYSIIYDAIDEIKSALEGMLEPKQVEEIVGMVDVQQVFKISKVGTVAGCFVQEGKITRNSFIRVIRGGIVEYPKKEGVHGELSSLRRFKDNVPEVKNGFECGLTLKNYNDLKEGDQLEIYEIKEVKQTLS
ncbi:MAG: translation initiation factor IF-2 [Aureispira sp.]